MVHFGRGLTHYSLNFTVGFGASAGQGRLLGRFGHYSLRIQANNPEQEEAEEELEVTYSGEDIEIGFNVNYLLDALGAVDDDSVTLSVLDGNSSCLIRQPGMDECKFVVMPMRL